MQRSYDRRRFIHTTAAAGMGLTLSAAASKLYGSTAPLASRVGIIGLDTSHVIAFTKALNDPAAAPDIAGYRVVAAYPQGSRDIASSASRIPGYVKEMQGMGVQIVDSIEELLQKVDVVMLETNDGRLHLEQALPVLRAGKRMFIDKPIAASLSDARAIFDAADRYNVPVFSSSSLRYMASVQDVVRGKVGRVMGAETFSPSPLESTHPDLYWYGIHGVETLFTVMGTGCKSVVRVHTEGADVVAGTWEGGRIGTFRGIRAGEKGYGGYVFGDKSITTLGPYDGYRGLLVQIISFFRSGKPPVSREETLEIFAFMDAADESKKRGGVPVTIEEMMKRSEVR